MLHTEPQGPRGSRPSFKQTPRTYELGGEYAMKYPQIADADKQPMEGDRERRGRRGADAATRVHTRALRAAVGGPRSGADRPAAPGGDGRERG